MLRRVFLALTAVAAAIVACGSFGDADDAAPSTPAPDAGESEASAAVDASTCGELTSDPGNCGACGHSCLGGACVAGRCEPVKIGASTDAPVRMLVADRDDVYWMTGEQALGGLGYVYSCPKAGCPPTGPIVVVGKDSTATLATDGTNTYATFMFTSRKLSRVGPGASETKITGFEAYDQLDFMSVQAPYVYFNELDRSLIVPGQNYVRAILRWQPGGAPAPIGEFFATDAAPVNTVPTVFNATRAFLAAVNVPRIVTCALADCSTWSMFFDGINDYVRSITASDADVYWVGSQKTVVSCPADVVPCTAAHVELTLEALGSTPRSVTWTGGKLFVTTEGGDLVECEAKDCGKTKRVVAHETSLGDELALVGHAVFADESAIYWVARDDDVAAKTWRIMKIAR